MITSAKFQNFKALRDVKINFQSRMTVLVGPNGCGKTSIFQAIQLLTTLGTLEREARPYVHTVTKIANQDKEINLSDWYGRKCLNYSPAKFSLSIMGGSNDYSSSIEFVVEARTQTQKATVKLKTLKNEWVGYLYKTDGTWQTPDEDSYPVHEIQHFDRAMFIRFVSSRMVAPQLVEQYPPQLQEDGSGLANVLMHLYSKYPSRFEQLQSAFCRVIRGVKTIRFDKSAVEGTKFFGDVLLIDYDHIQGVAAKHLSSGTLYGLGILTAIFNPESPSVILLDDLDNGLHPKAQMELLDVLQEVLKEQPQLQIIATSHSPYILDRLEPNEVRILNIDEEGCTVCRSLEEAPEFDRWKESMTPGEFWSHFGDDWVKKPKVATELAAS